MKHIILVPPCHSCQALLAWVITNQQISACHLCEVAGVVRFLQRKHGRQQLPQGGQQRRLRAREDAHGALRVRRRRRRAIVGLWVRRRRDGRRPPRLHSDDIHGLY